jgi:hypothetical protein
MNTQGDVAGIRPFRSSVSGRRPGKDLWKQTVSVADLLRVSFGRG